jgi:hypothetical protein
VPGNELPAVPAPRAAMPPLVAPTQLKLELPNGSSMRFGLLWQARFEASENATDDAVSKNFFLGRFAILA